MIHYLFVFEKQKLLRSIVLYVANSSGKSNFIKAIERMGSCVISSVKLNETDELNYTPFLLSFVFEIKKTKETPLFIRTEEGITVFDSFKEGKSKEKATNQLRGFSESLKLFQDLKLGIKNVETIESDIYFEEKFPGASEESKTELRKNFLGEIGIELKTVHNKYDDNGKIKGTISWNKNEKESEGTKKIIDLSGPLFSTLLDGQPLIVDELDAKLHPLITMQMIKLFNSPETNPNNAQLLFADGTKVRKDANLEKNYIAGRYGAIPYITDLNW